jgi:hypothetical protein
MTMYVPDARIDDPFPTLVRQHATLNSWPPTPVPAGAAGSLSENKGLLLVIAAATAYFLWGHHLHRAVRGARTKRAVRTLMQRQAEYGRKPGWFALAWREGEGGGFKEAIGPRPTKAAAQAAAETLRDEGYARVSVEHGTMNSLDAKYRRRT